MRAWALLISILVVGPMPAWLKAQTLPGETIPGLAGSWKMNRLLVSTSASGPVDLIERGGASWLTFDADGRFVLTQQEPGDPRRIPVSGGWRPLSPASIELRSDGGAPQVFGVAVAGETLLLSGSLSIDLDGDGVQEPGSFEGELQREEDKLADGSGVVGAWVRSDGRIRTYRFHVPAVLADRGPFPLVFAFHGGSSRGDEMQWLTGLDAQADEVGVAVAYPDAVEGNWAIGCDCTPADREGISDVAFVERLIDQLSEQLPVDAGRIYATGFSQGGMFASRLACEIPHRVAGIATVGGALTQVLASRCAPSRPVPVVAFHGTADPSVPYGGSPTVLAATATLGFWGAVDGCGGSVVEPVADLSDDGTLVTRTRYLDCVAGTEVVLYSIEGGGHTWPGSPVAFPLGLGRVSYDISANRLMLESFSRHSLLR